MFKHVQEFASSFLALKSRCPSLPVAPNSATLSDGADPKCKGLTCFSKTQNERKVPVNFTAYDGRTPSLKQKVKHCKNTFFHERAGKGKVFKHLQKFASSFLTPGTLSSATLTDTWGRPQVQESNMLFQDLKRKKSRGQLHRI